MITIRNKEEMEKYYVEEVNTYVFKDDVEFLFTVNVKAHIKALNIKAGCITAWDIDAWDMTTWGINAWNIRACDIYACDINADDIKAHNINADDIKAEDVKANNIKAGNINAWNVNANDISYYAVCFAYNHIHCNSIEGRRENSKHFVLDGRLFVREGR